MLAQLHVAPCRSFITLVRLPTAMSLPVIAYIHSQPIAAGPHHRLFIDGAADGADQREWPLATLAASSSSPRLSLPPVDRRANMLLTKWVLTKSW